MAVITNKKAKDVKISYIGGGSRQWAWHFMSDLAIDETMSGIVRLYDTDKESALRNSIIGNKFNSLPDCKSNWIYEASSTLEEALKDSDFIVISILPAALDKEMRSDVHTPEKYGIFQSVGDTVGPGGYIRALRTIPLYVEIAEAIKKYAPHAWVISYTNPMSMCVRVLYEVFPEIKAFGCCHEVFGTQELLAEALKESTGITVSDRSEIKINVSGINHFTWIDEAVYQGIDLFPIYKKFAEKYKENGYLKDSSSEGMPFINTHKVKFDLFERYNTIAAAGDRHLIEFLPETYLRNKSDGERWRYWLTSVDFRVNLQKEKNEYQSRIISGKEELKLKPSGEEGVQQIKALSGLQDLITNVNIPNTSQIGWLPEGFIVETNAVFRAGSVKPLVCRDLPLEVQTLIITHAMNQESWIRSFFAKDKKALFNTFINDPMVRSLSLTDARFLFEEMIANTSDYLPDWLTG